jgi:hypothetical protein
VARTASFRIELVSCKGVTPAHVCAFAAWCMMLVHAGKFPECSTTGIMVLRRVFVCWRAARSVSNGGTPVVCLVLPAAEFPLVLAARFLRRSGVTSLQCCCRFTGAVRSEANLGKRCKELTFVTSCQKAF